MHKDDLLIRCPIGLAIGAGLEQLSAIMSAQAQGLRVLALDGNPHAPGLCVADFAKVVDLRDTEAVIAVARAHGVDFTLPTPIGRMLTTQAAVHEALGLRGVQPACASFCTDKYQFHQLMRETGIDIPQQNALLSTHDFGELDPLSLTYPLVLKPRCGSGSRGVRVVASAQNWLAAMKVFQAEPSSDGWLLESFVDGVVLGVDGAMMGGEPQIVLVREKHMSPWPHRVELAYRAPAVLPDETMYSLRDMLVRAMAALHVNDTLFHADVILRPNGIPTLIELSARPSGLRIASEMVPACTGVDLLSQGLSLHRFGQADFKPKQARPTLLHYWHHGGGLVQCVPDSHTLRSLPHVLSAEISWKSGQHVQWPASVSELLPAGHLLVSAPTWEEIDATLSKALSLFEIIPDEHTQRTR